MPTGQQGGQIDVRAMSEMERVHGRLEDYRYARDLISNPMAKAEIEADEGASTSEGWRHDD